MKIAQHRCRACGENARLTKVKGRNAWLCSDCHFVHVEQRAPEEVEAEAAETKPVRKSKTRRHA